MLPLFFILAAVGGYLLGLNPVRPCDHQGRGAWRHPPHRLRQYRRDQRAAHRTQRFGAGDFAARRRQSGPCALAIQRPRRLAGRRCLADDRAYQIGLVAGAAAFVGHCYPVWLGFKGGKGVATFFGVLFAGPWPLGLVAGVVWLAVATMFRYSSLAALARRRRAGCWR